MKSPHKYYYRTENGEFGPVSAAELNRLVAVGDLLQSDCVRKMDSERWHIASECKGLCDPEKTSERIPAKTVQDSSSLERWPEHAVGGFGGALQEGVVLGRRTAEVALGDQRGQPKMGDGLRSETLNSAMVRGGWLEWVLLWPWWKLVLQIFRWLWVRYAVRLRDRHPIEIGFVTGTVLAFPGWLLGWLLVWSIGVGGGGQSALEGLHFVNASALVAERVSTRELVWPTSTETEFFKDFESRFDAETLGRIRKHRGKGAYEDAPINLFQSRSVSLDLGNNVSNDGQAIVVLRAELTYCWMYLIGEDGTLIPPVALDDSSHLWIGTNAAGDGDPLSAFFVSIPKSGVYHIVLLMTPSKGRPAEFDAGSGLGDGDVMADPTFEAYGLSCQFNIAPVEHFLRR